MTYKLVKFEDGRYAVRAWFFGYKYLSIKNCEYTWRQPNHIDSYCKGTKEQAIKALAIQQDKGTLV